MPTALKIRPGEKKKKKNSAVTAKTAIKKKIALYSVTFKSAVLNLLIIEKVREKDIVITRRQRTKAAYDNDGETLNNFFFNILFKYYHFNIVTKNGMRRIIILLPKK